MYKVAFSGLPGVGKSTILANIKHNINCIVSSEVAREIFMQLPDCDINPSFFQGMIFFKTIQNERDFDKNRNGNVIFYDRTWFEQLIFAYLYGCLDMPVIISLFDKFSSQLKPYDLILVFRGGQKYFDIWESVVMNDSVRKGTIIKYYKGGLHSFYQKFEDILLQLIERYKNKNKGVKVSQICISDFIRENSVEWNLVEELVLGLLHPYIKINLKGVYCLVEAVDCVDTENIPKGQKGQIFIKN